LRNEYLANLLQPRLISQWNRARLTPLDGLHFLKIVNQGCQTRAKAVLIFVGF
jgi:hypothetical protein